MPNIFAFAVLALWPVVSVILFHRLPVGRAVIASLLVAYLFLPPPPTGFDFPLLPPLTKETIPSLVVALACLVMYRDRLSLWPESRAGRVLVVLFVLSPMATVLTNPEPVFWGRIGLPGLRLREGLGIMVNQSLLLVPFLVARNLLRRADDHRDLLAALFIGGLVYSLPMLVEIRLSPQLNIWIYGFFQHNFDQMIRFGGFRPIVFLYHGIWVAFFAMTAVVAGVALARGLPSRRGLAATGAVYLLAVLVLSKSLAGILYALVLAPLVLFLGRRWQLHLAVALACVALAYPVMKGAGVVPTEAILAQAARIDDDRANSLRFRFQQEDILLDRAYEKPLFGWGSWGRNHILDENTGAILTVTDGRWIILIGVLGWVGFLAEFGLLTLPIFLIWRKAMQGDAAALSPWIAPLTLLLSVNVIDLIPNATITPLTWLLAGAVLGYAEAHVAVRKPRFATPLRTIL
ncbi:MAG: hypothetical protein GW886_08070 [Rhodobacterales bacterium]|nr:hypothetical protein [Rhodobacterales bacterium]